MPRSRGPGRSMHAQAPYPDEHEGSMRTDAEPIRSGAGQREGELASFARLRLDVVAPLCAAEISRQIARPSPLPGPVRDVSAR